MDGKFTISLRVGNEIVEKTLDLSEQDFDPERRVLFPAEFMVFYNDCERAVNDPRLFAYLKSRYGYASVDSGYAITDSGEFNEGLDLATEQHV